MTTDGGEDTMAIGPNRDCWCDDWPQPECPQALHATWAALPLEQLPAEAAQHFPIFSPDRRSGTINVLETLAYRDGGRWALTDEQLAWVFAILRRLPTEVVAFVLDRCMIEVIAPESCRVLSPITAGQGRWWILVGDACSEGTFVHAVARCWCLHGVDTADRWGTLEDEEHRDREAAALVRRWGFEPPEHHYPTKEHSDG